MTLERTLKFSYKRLPEKSLSYNANKQQKSVLKMVELLSIKENKGFFTA
jgi:hypothetical protein